MVTPPQGAPPQAAIRGAYGRDSRPALSAVGSPVDLSAFRHLYPFRHHFTHLGVWRCHYVDEGAGPPVLMLHGNPTWSFYYRRLIRELSTDHRAIAPDHLGCGLSDKPAAGEYPFRLADRVANLGTLVERIGLGNDLSLVLHDWGGMIGLAWALKNPSRLRRLVITNTAGFFPPGGRSIPLRLRVLRDLRAIGAPAILGLNLFARAALWLAPARRLAPSVRRGLLAPYGRPRHRLALLRFVQDIPLRPGDASYGLVKWVSRHLHRLEGIPTLILWGGRDFVFDRTYFDEWRRRLPQAECHFFPGAGHYLLEDEPETCARLIRSFFARHPL
jgi:pimeloyl-ACP methyl ester carboxylesterase